MHKDDEEMDRLTPAERAAADALLSSLFSGKETDLDKPRTCACGAVNVPNLDEAPDFALAVHSFMCGVHPREVSVLTRDDQTWHSLRACLMPSEEVTAEHDAGKPLPGIIKERGKEGVKVADLENDGPAVTGDPRLYLRKSIPTADNKRL